MRALQHTRPDPTCSPGPEFIFNVLEVAGAKEPLYNFLGAVSGPGFIDWRPNWYQIYEDIYLSLMRPGAAPSKLAADRLGRKLSDRLWWQHGSAQTTADRDPHRVPFDLNTLFPIPRAVIRRGFRPDGQAWMMANWGVPTPLRRVSLAMELRRSTGGRTRQDAVFRFWSEDWSPGIAIMRLRHRWPDLEFRLKVQFLEDVGGFSEVHGLAAQSGQVRRCDG